MLFEKEPIKDKILREHFDLIDKWEKKGYGDSFVTTIKHKGDADKIAEYARKKGFKEVRVGEGLIFCQVTIKRNV